MMSYTTLYGCFALTSLLLTNALILLARYVRQVQNPPSDADFEELIKEKEALETQSTLDERAMTSLKATVDQLQNDLKKLEEVLKVKTEELEAFKASPHHSNLS